MIDAKLNLVETFEEASEFQEWMGQPRKWLGLDLETTGVNCGLDKIRTIQIGDEHTGWTFRAEGPNGVGGLALEALRNYDGRILTHNAIFESSMLRAAGYPLKETQVDDTMVMAHIDGSGMSTALKAVARRLVDKSAAEAGKALQVGFAKQGWDWDTVPVEFPPYWAYGALDPVLTCRVAAELWPKVRKHSTIYDRELGCIGTLGRAMVTGLTLDIGYAKQQSETIGAYLAALEPYLPCDPNSPPQLVKFLQSRGAELTVKTEKDNWSTDDDVLKSFQSQIPELEHIRNYRKHDKMKTSYFDNALALHKDGVVHPSVHVLGAPKTGRMSVTAPALQTVPKSRQGRTAYVAREGMTLIAADFNGMEMRMLASQAGEARMLAEFAKGVDMHTWVAEMTGAPRAVAKAAAFAKIYGAGIEKFAATAGISIEAAEQFLAKYDELFPAVRQFQDNNNALVHSSRPHSKTWGVVHTWTGRPLMVLKDKAYASTNYIIQGGCAELTKLKICELDAAGLGDAIRLPIHDEIIFEVYDEDVAEAEATISTVMAENDLFDVDFPVEVEHAKVWGDMYD